MNSKTEEIIKDCKAELLAKDAEIERLKKDKANLIENVKELHTNSKEIIEENVIKFTDMIKRTIRLHGITENQVETYLLIGFYDIFSKNQRIKSISVEDIGEVIYSSLLHGMPKSDSMEIAKAVHDLINRE